MTARLGAILRADVTIAKPGTAPQSRCPGGGACFDPEHAGNRRRSSSRNPLTRAQAPGTNVDGRAAVSKSGVVF